MACVSLVWFIVLINGYPSSFFWAEMGLREGSSLSLLLFILVMDNLSLKINEEKALGIFSGLRLAKWINVSIFLIFF